MCTGIAGYYAAGLLALAMVALDVTGARADSPDGPTISNVQVNGTNVTATIAPAYDDATTETAEMYIDTIGLDGSGIPMTLSGASGTVTASGTLPALPIGSSHTA